MKTETINKISLNLKEKLSKGEKIYIKGTTESSKHYLCTTENMLKAEVISFDLTTGSIKIKVLEHLKEHMIGEYFVVKPWYFEYLN